MSTTTETGKGRDEIREAVDKLSAETVSRLLRASIAVEQNKGKKSETKEQYIVRIEAQLSVLRLQLGNQLSRFEGLWDRVYGHKPDLDESLQVIQVEEMIEYCDGAQFMENFFERKHNYVKDVKAKMSEMGAWPLPNDDSLFECFKHLKV